MSPEVDTILGSSARKIVLGLGEHGPAFAQGTAALMAMMLTLSAQEYDRAADIRVAENAQMRALFGALARDAGDAALKAKLETAAKAADESLRISVLNAGNAALRRLLSEAMIDAEERGDAQALKRIWTVLQAMAARRVVTLG